MRVAHSLSSLLNMSAGPSYSVPSLAVSQAQLGADIELHSLDGTPIHCQRGLADIRHQRRFASIPVLHRLGISPDMSSALRHGRFDIIHTHGLWTHPNTYMSSRAAFIVAPRGMLTSVALGFSPLKKKLFCLLRQNHTLRRTRLFHATSASEHQDIRAFGLEQPVAIIPNGIDVPLFRQRPRKTKRRRLITLGRIHPKKGLDSLIAAWSRLEKVFPDWDLEIIGPDQIGHRSELEAQAQAHKLQRVYFHDAMHGAEKTICMESADLFILPSKSENFGMTVAESLALSVPVIATIGTPWSGLEERRCGWWVGHSSEDLGNGLRQAMEKPRAELEVMGQLGQDWMRSEFSWSRIAEMSLEAYRWTVTGGDKPPFIHLG